MKRCPECSDGFVCLTCRCAYERCSDKWGEMHHPWECPDCEPRKGK